VQEMGSAMRSLTRGGCSGRSTQSPDGQLFQARKGRRSIDSEKDPIDRAGAGGAGRAGSV
jgi:hypothetical protein